MVIACGEKVLSKLATAACPVCGSSRHNHLHERTDNDCDVTISNSFRCRICGARWVFKYTLTDCVAVQTPAGSVRVEFLRNVKAERVVIFDEDEDVAEDEEEEEEEELLAAIAFRKGEKVVGVLRTDALGYLFRCSKGGCKLPVDSFKLI